MARETPQDYVNRILKESDLTHRQVAQRAKVLGHKLSAGYVHNIASGQVDNPSIRLTQALAAGLGRPELEVFSVFRGKPITDEAKYKESLFAFLWEQYKELRKGDREELDVTLRILSNEIQRRILSYSERQTKLKP